MAPEVRQLVTNPADDGSAMMQRGTALGIQMTAEIINLNKVRKAKERAGKEQRAEENRVRHGRTKAERDVDEARRSAEKAHLDGARREVPRDGYARSGETEEDIDPGSAS